MLSRFPAPWPLAAAAAMTAVGLLSPFTFAQPHSDASDHANHKDAAKPSAVGDPYPLDTDAATGEPLGGKPVKVVHEGRELRFASRANADAFAKDPATHLAKVDAAIIADQAPVYALETCPVSGGKLGSMGDPHRIVVGNRLVQLCCEGCVEDATKDPAATIAKLDAAVIEKQKADYPLETCVIAGHKLGQMGEPFDMVVAGRLVRLCCDGCQTDVRQNVASVVSQIDAARQAKAGEAGPATQPASN